MSDTTPAPSSLEAELAELKATLAGLQQTINTGQGGTFPHTAILAGSPPHLHLGPVDENGFVLPGHWNTETGLWEAPGAAPSAATV